MAESHRLDPIGRPYAPESRPRLDDVDADHFARVDIRIGRVVEAAVLPEARQPSLRLRVDFGPLVGTLTTVAKVAHYDPEALVGRTVVGAINLGVRRVAGTASQFLVLGGLEADGTVRLLAPDDDLPPGSVVG